jgi:hypothetical protein
MRDLGSLADGVRPFFLPTVSSLGLMGFISC